MESGFYSTGQVARQLGVSPAQVRSLCENGVVAAETTPGGQWRVPAYEVERLKRDGFPPIPRPMPIESGPAPNGRPARKDQEPPAGPSAEVVSAQDQVAITRSALEKRRIDREIEEAEDWFRKRQRQQEAAALVERKKDEAIVAEQRRRRWMQGWMRYALNSVPYGARGEVEIEVHGEVEAALSKLQADEPEAILRPLVDAAVRRALRPWQHKQDLQTPRDIWGSVGNAISVPEIHHIGAYFGFPYRETRLLRVRHPEAS